MDWSLRGKTIRLLNQVGINPKRVFPHLKTEELDARGNVMYWKLPNKDEEKAFFKKKR